MLQVNTIKNSKVGRYNSTKKNIISQLKFGLPIAWAGMPTENRELGQALFDGKLFTYCSQYLDFMNYRAASL